jgi:hypothetical protein
VTQIQMFPVKPSTDGNLVGLTIRLPEQCPRCGGNDAAIGAGRGPHKASIICACGKHLGWMSIATFNFVAETVRHFGRPNEPISVTRKPFTTTAG